MRPRARSMWRALTTWGRLNTLACRATGGLLRLKLQGIHGIPRFVMRSGRLPRLRRQQLYHRYRTVHRWRADTNLTPSGSGKGTDPMPCHEQLGGRAVIAGDSPWGQVSQHPPFTMGRLHAIPCQCTGASMLTTPYRACWIMVWIKANFSSTGGVSTKG